MDEWQALHNFWNSFGVTAYDESSVPVGAGFPRITYEAQTSDFGNEVSLSASLWYKSTSWAAISQKAVDIKRAIGMGGVMLPCDGGAIWVKRGNPFAQRMSDPEDDEIRRIILRIETEFITKE